MRQKPKNEEKDRSIEVVRVIYDMLSAVSENDVVDGSREYWNEIPVAQFRNIRLFVNGHNKAISMLVIPTGDSTPDCAIFHVITENTGKNVPPHEKYEHRLMRKDLFERAFYCNYANGITAQNFTTAKITDLAEVFADRLAEIKQLKNGSVQEKSDAMTFFGRLILNFLMKSNK